MFQTRDIIQNISNFWTRSITMISLGIDSNVDKYLADFHKRNAINKIDLIELRTDEKYGNFLIHQVAGAIVGRDRRRRATMQTQRRPTDGSRFDHILRARRR
jgi:hypothetical protein